MGGCDINSMEGDLILNLDVPSPFGGTSTSNTKVDINGNIVDELRKENGAPWWKRLFGDTSVTRGAPQEILEQLDGGVVILFDGNVCDNSKSFVENGIVFPLSKERCITITSQALHPSDTMEMMMPSDEALEAMADQMIEQMGADGPKVRALANKFFEDTDTNGDDKIDKYEAVVFMRNMLERQLDQMFSMGGMGPGVTPEMINAQKEPMLAAVPDQVEQMAVQMPFPWSRAVAMQMMISHAMGFATGPGGPDMASEPPPGDRQEALTEDLDNVRELYKEGHTAKPSSAMDGVWSLENANRLKSGDFSPGNKNGLQIRDKGERVHLEMRWDCAVEPGTEPYPGFVGKLEVELGGSMIWETDTCAVFTATGKQVTYQGAGQPPSFQEMWQGEGATHDEEPAVLTFHLYADENCLRISGNMGRVGSYWQ